MRLYIFKQTLIFDTWSLCHFRARGWVINKYLVQKDLAQTNVFTIIFASRKPASLTSSYVHLCIHVAAVVRGR